MLAAIGILIVSKEIHTTLGVLPAANDPRRPHPRDPAQLHRHEPRRRPDRRHQPADPDRHARIRSPLARKVPAPLIVLAVAIPLGMYFELEARTTTASSAPSTTSAPTT
jgi:hypothetical protein